MKFRNNTSHVLLIGVNSNHRILPKAGEYKNTGFIIQFVGFPV